MNRKSPSTTVTESPRPAVRQRPKIRHVAEYCGVAPSTVSGILNNRADCFASQATRKRVTDAVRKLGYRPNLTARSLAKGKTFTFGLVSTALDIEPISQTCMSFEHHARELGYMCLMSFEPNDQEMENRQIRSLVDRGVDGMFVMPCEHGDHEQLLDEYRHGMPIVTLDGANRCDLPVDDVSVDHYTGGCLQAEHILSMGKKRVLFANSQQTCWVVEQRLAGARQTLLEAGAPEPLRMDCPMPARPLMAWDHNDHRFVLDYIETHRGEFDAVIGAGDEICLGTVGLLMQAGLRVPEDVIAIGYDGISLTANTLCPLSSMQNPAGTIGETAVNLLLDQIKNKAADRPVKQIKIPPTLIARASTLGKGHSVT